MPSLNKKQMIAMISIPVLAGVALIFLPHLNAEESKVRVTKQSSSILNRMNVHSSPKYDLVVQGREYKNILGAPNFYLELKNPHAIMFMVAREGRGKNIIIKYLDGAPDVVFSDEYDAFPFRIWGAQIYLESSSPEKIVFVANGGTHRYEFDVKGSKFTTSIRPKM